MNPLTKYFAVLKFLKRDLLIIMLLAVSLVVGAYVVIESSQQ